jgi:hypothetical protein
MWNKSQICFRMLKGFQKEDQFNLLHTLSMHVGIQITICF